MLKRVFLGVALSSMLAFAPYATSALTTPAAAPSCACCGADCSCDDCQCDANGCDCDAGGDCACNADCCMNCCSK